MPEAITASEAITRDIAWGLYIHWPFCVSKCPYCDFNSHVRESVNQTAWRDALVREIAYAGAQAGRPPLQSIFFGGGTPSLMPPETVAAAIAQAKASFQADDDIEITLEANPSTIEAQTFPALAQAGINRLSLGIQSFDDEVLRFLGRAHDAAEAKGAITAAQQAVARVSFDLIYALPGQSRKAWAAQLDEALAFGTQHLSVYQLTIEPNTGFQGQVARGVFTPMDDDAAADLFEDTRARLSKAGLPAYETSNHAAPGQECRHNLVYWRGEPYAAVGPGAHGRWRSAAGWHATSNHKKPERWLKQVQAREHGTSEQIFIPPQGRAEEILLTALRLRSGLNLAQASALSGTDVAALIDTEALAELVAQGWISTDGQQIALREKAHPVANQIVKQLLA